MLPIRYVFILVAFAILAGGGIGVGLAEVHRNATQSRAYDTRNFHSFSATRQIERAPYTLDTVTIAGHGGTAEIEWYCGAWSSLSDHGSSQVSLYVDGHLLGTSVLSGPGGPLNVRAGIVRWVGPLSAGKHVVAVRVDQSVGRVALPLVNASASVQEGVDVTEYAE